ncbi:MAG: response regulator transcription factor [Deltaproteobacteria bacterium]|nr:response regulator transcription factor [Deltaproteobacteria bacterium]
MSPLVLIVEDERDLLAALEYNLKREGYRTRGVGRGRDAVAAATGDDPPDLVLLDLMLPDISGTEVCRTIRANERTRTTPIVMLTAKTDEVDRVVGFEVGADDYVAKPFSVRELLLRIRAVLRRARPEELAQAAEAFEMGRLRIDIAAHRSWVDGEEVVLTALEFRLLRTLMERRGRVQSREMLLTDVWGMSPEVTTRTVDTHVKRLRQKLGVAGPYVETLRGVGYRFAADVRDTAAKGRARS